ncbi:MAG: maleylpyruvate isomerase N-terminal domain-containing protein [Anaerolineales bacterium]|nr:maleylpyruvate isomerase N-terminal domain-containing protein [Anaerolineales bacterium]
MAHHATDHRAQILRTLHDLGAPTFEQNFAIYMENVTPMTIHQELIGHIGTRRAEWDALLRQVPAEQMNQLVLDSWSVRDVIAIITWKERRLIETIHDRTVIDASFSEIPQVEQASILEAGRALSLPALLDQHQVTHREMLDALRALTDDDLNAGRIDGLPPDEQFWKAIAAATWWSYPAFSAVVKGDGGTLSL